MAEHPTNMHLDCKSASGASVQCERENDELAHGTFWRGSSARRRADGDEERAGVLPDEPPPGWPGGDDA